MNRIITTLLLSILISASSVSQNQHNSSIEVIRAKIDASRSAQSIYNLPGKVRKIRSRIQQIRNRLCSNRFVVNIQNPQGSLPEGSMMWLEDKNWGLKFGVLVPTRKTHVHIVITNKKGEEVSTIVNKELRKGWNNFKWKRNRNPHGVYNIQVTMDGHTMTQNFES